MLAAVAVAFAAGQASVFAAQDSPQPHSEAAKPSGVAGQASKLDSTSEPSDAVVAELIRQLDADAYLARQEATRRLAQSGVAAAKPLTAAALGDNLEIAIRALDALRLLGHSDDLDTQSAGFAALEQLATAENRGVSARAKTALVELRKFASPRAIVALKERGAEFLDERRPQEEIPVAGGGVIMLGGRFSPMSTYYLPGVQVVIGEKWKGKPSDLRLLNRIENLSQIVFTGPKIDDEAISQLRIAGTSPVLQIAMHSCKVSDRGIAHLAGFSSLIYLEITQIPLTDASVSTIARLSKLKSVRLFGTKVTAAGAKQLAAALPEATIDRRGGALLGVSGSVGEQPCIINEVRPGSAAAKAGLEKNDVIVKFGETGVQSFTELTAAISDKTGGDKVEIEFARADASGKMQPHKTIVTLGSW
jgi:hypothetical protein